MSEAYDLKKIKKKLKNSQKNKKKKLLKTIAKLKMFKKIANIQKF